EIPGVTCPVPEGAFYAYPSVKGVLGKEIRGQRPQTSAALAAVILEHAEVAVVPGEAFGTQGYFRLSYAMSDADLEEGVGRAGTDAGMAPAAIDHRRARLVPLPAAVRHRPFGAEDPR